ncbi:MAG: tyrosine--tRNA ligase [Crocinitomicaceae bacterium]|jgi:tyrosyl-tRNA synthetase
MKMNLIAELQWRGMIQDVIPGTEEQLLKEMTTGYVGFDPTSDSLHVGSLLPIMLLVHLQKAGHRPIALVGGATGMVGDPSGKSAERNLLDEESLKKNIEGVSNQLKKFLNFDEGENKALLLNNYDWMKNFSFLDFIRDIGKHITVNYMMSKDSVKKRIETGISFTEFSYQLLQGYDFLHLNKSFDCKLQIGGSDQWGNITTGTELIRRKGGSDSFAFTCPLLTKADGGKFGKTESGTIWLDPSKTSPYQFYQFWLNASDEDAKKLVRYFTLLSKEEIDQLESEHNEAPHLRILQKAIAEDVTIRVHGKEALEAAIIASNILFGKSTSDDLKKLSNEQIYEIFDGVPKATISYTEIENGLSIVDALVAKSNFLPSNGEAKRELKANAISVNKEKVSDSFTFSTENLINNKISLIGKGKKNNYLLIFE